MICPNCYREVKEGSVYCGHCGFMLDKTQNNGIIGKIKPIHYLLISAIVLCIIISALTFHKSKPAIPTESKILEDIIELDDFLSDGGYGLAVDSSQISNRNTDYNKKEDTLQFDILASNEKYTYDVKYRIKYILDDDSWKLFDCANIDSYIRLKEDQYLSSDMAKESIDYLYDTVDYVSSDIEPKRNRVTHLFEATKSNYYIKTTYSVSVECQFYPLYDDIYNAWVNDIKDTVISEDFDIVGEWLYQDSERYYYVNVIEGNKEYVTVTYQLENATVMDSLGTRWMPATIASENPVKCNVGEYGMTEKYFISPPGQDDYSASIWMYLGEKNSETQLTHGTGYGLSVDGYFLNKIS